MGSARAIEPETPKIKTLKINVFTADMANLLFVGPEDAIMASSSTRPESNPLFGSLIARRGVSCFAIRSAGRPWKSKRDAEA
ncbi:hypothetical protein [Singulisphaera acidiphila]|uniref:hypothetical protein n=1 Tax=Singulisphaera acidiphila TaxID=466153 RepID=UPI0012B5397E|nr:hypothetical protein [Singulisphaera acidiphila]